MTDLQLQVFYDLLCVYLENPSYPLDWEERQGLISLQDKLGNEPVFILPLDIAKELYKKE